jgi:hypothetical protein
MAMCVAFASKSSEIRPWLPPEGGRRDAGWRRDVLADGLEDLADEALRRPVRHGDATTGAADAKHLGGDAGGVRREHAAEGREHGVEDAVVEGQRLGVRLEEGDAAQALRGCALAAALEELGNVVGRGDVAPAARRGERGVAVAGGDIEDALAGAQVGGFAERFPTIWRVVPTTE